MTTKEYRIGNEWPNDLPTCIVPWTSITLSANGDIKPCCKFTSDKKLALLVARHCRINKNQISKLYPC